ncbi:MAG: hypothetical protein HKN47_01025 [Pirellulaceae bacterium]|nr:hypothetical protein [Pirellulaceae bacterium]
MTTVIAAFCVSDAIAQPMINQQVPFQNLGSSFYEQNGVSWNLRGPNFFANFGGNNVVAPFGNPDPNAGANIGAAFQNGRTSGNISFNFNQGSNRSNVTTTPSVTTMNGVPGSISDQSMRPFVTGITPVVGGQTFFPVQPPHNSGDQVLGNYQRAQQADLQRRMQANYDAKQRKALEDFQRGLKAEEEGNLRMARANYRRALSAAVGPLRIEVMQRLRARGW